MTPRQFHDEVIALGWHASDDLSRLQLLRPSDEQTLEQTIESLVAAGIVTQFQADMIAAGNSTQLLIDDYILRDVLGQAAWDECFWPCIAIWIAWSRSK